jgi:multidrug efflux system outer membrane protein
VIRLAPMKWLVLSLATLALGACANLGHPLPPPPPVPRAFTEPQPAEAAPLAADWWRAFGSDDLSALIAAAVGANPDIGIAMEHVRQAESQVRVAGASLFPALDVGADTAHRQTRDSGASWVASDSSAATLSASYEVDLWGGVASGVRSAKYALHASRFDLENARLTVVAGVADAYLQVLSLRSRLVIARDNVAIAERVYKVVDSRQRNGAASELDRARQEAVVLSQQAAVPPLELQERQTLFALAVLLGRAPEGFDTAASGLDGLNLPRVAPGLPSLLLIRRPDLATAEAQLASAHANVGVARAALLPSIQLTGSAGLASTVLINVLKAPTTVLSIGAALLQPIFEGGRLRAQVAGAESHERELVEAYRKAILAALADVESALATISHSADQEALQERVVEQSRLALKLAEIRYREGADDLLVLLDAQRSLFQAEDQLIQLRFAQLQASVSLFKALGGGWVVPPNAATQATGGWSKRPCFFPSGGPSRLSRGLPT